MDTWLENELPEEWPEQNTEQDNDHTVESFDSRTTGSQLGQTVAIQLQPDKVKETKWKAVLDASKPNADHLQGLFDLQEDAEKFPQAQDTSASESDLSSEAKKTQILKLFTKAKNTYTNVKLDALTTSLQGHQPEDEKSDIINNLMNDGNNALSRIRKASNLDMRAVYENQNNTSNENSVVQVTPSSKQDSSLDDLSHLDQSNGSTLSSLTDHNATANSTHRYSQHKPAPRPMKSAESVNNPTVRFKTPMHTPARSELYEPEVPSLAIPESSFDLEQQPFMSFVENEYRQQQIPLTTSASETSGTAIRPPAHQVRRDTMIYSRPPSSASQSADPRPQAYQHSHHQHPQPQQPQQPQPSTVRHHPSKGSTWGSSMRQHFMGSKANTSVDTSVDKVFDVSVAVNNIPLRDISLPNIEDKNMSISRKNVSFSGSLYHIVQQVRSVDHSNIDFEIDLSRMELECLKGLDDLLPNLVKADLSKNFIQVVEGLPASLLELNLSHNSLNRMTAFPLMFVNNLNIAHNNLEDLTCLSHLRALSHLDISHNTIKSLKGIESLHSLETLNIGENNLRSLKISHNKLRNLRASKNNIGAVELDTPQLEVLDLSDNSILSLDPMDSVRKLYICNNGAKLDFKGWNSLEELYYDGNTVATNFNHLSPLVLSWTSGGSTTGFDPSGLISCQVLSIDKKSTLRALHNVGVLPTQQLNLIGLGLKSIPAWLPSCMPHLRCLNLAFNQLDDASLQTISEFKELRTLGLFGNGVTSFASLTLCLGKLNHIGALDLRGNPISNPVYPDMRTLLMDISNGSPTDQYNWLLTSVDWSIVLNEWHPEPLMPRKVHEYKQKLSQLKLWWLDGAVISEKPKSSRVWSNPRAVGLGEIKAGPATSSKVLETSYQTEANSTIDESLECPHDTQDAAVGQADKTVDQTSDDTLPDVEPRPRPQPIQTATGDYDLRFKFETPSQTHFSTPSRVSGEIGTIGKAKAQAARAAHSTPGTIKAVNPSTLSTPETVKSKYTSRPLAKSMPRVRKPSAKDMGAPKSLTAELTAEFILSIYKREYKSL